MPQTQTDKVLSMLGICRRAGKLEAGFDLVCEKIREKKAYLTLTAQDISDKTFKNLKYEADKQKIPCRRIGADRICLGKACGIKAGVLAVTDEGMA